MKYSSELFIKNIEYLIKYGGEPEIEIIMKGDKKFFIIAYEDFIDFYDENDNLITSLSPIQVVAPTDKVILPMEEKDLPTGIYKVEAIAYNAEGEMIYQPFWTQFYYEKIEVPDTGSFFGQFNITKTDHLLTGLIIFVAVVAGGVLIIMKTSRPKVHVAAVRASRGRRNARVAKSSKTTTRTRKATRIAKTTKTTKTRKR